MLYLLTSWWCMTNVSLCKTGSPKCRLALCCDATILATWCSGLNTLYTTELRKPSVSKYAVHLLKVHPTKSHSELTIPYVHRPSWQSLEGKALTRRRSLMPQSSTSGYSTLQPRFRQTSAPSRFPSSVDHILKYLLQWNRVHVKRNHIAVSLINFRITQQI